MVWAQGGLIGQMLPRTKADLKFQGTVIAEQAARINRPIRHGDLGQKVIDKRLLARAQLMAFGPPI
jgi:hypothetical protein